MMESPDRISWMMEAIDPAADLGDDAIDELYPFERLEVRIEAGSITAPRRAAPLKQAGFVTNRRGLRKVALVSGCLVATVVVVVATLVLSGSTPIRTPNPRFSKWELVSEQIASWQPASTSELGSDLGLTCPAVSTCYAQNPSSGDLEVTTNAGQIWQQVTVASGVVILSEFSCSTPTTCTVMGSPDGDYSGDFSLYTTTDGGQTWSAGGLIPVDQPDFVTCSSATNCLVLGLPNKGVAAMATSNAGQTWTKTDLPFGFYPRTGQCFSAGNCLLVGGAMAMYSSDGGDSWQPSSVPTGTGPVRSLSCVNSSDCFATTIGVTSTKGGSFLVTTNGGESFASLQTDGFGTSGPPVTTLMATSVSCFSTSGCWVSGVVNPTSDTTAKGLLSVTSDGGGTWSPSILPADVLAVDNVSCPDATTCFALANTLPAPESNTVLESGFVLLELQH
jgi:hypothetical protein